MRTDMKVIGEKLTRGEKSLEELRSAWKSCEKRCEVVARAWKSSATPIGKLGLWIL